jgi:hypothetical protein
MTVGVLIFFAIVGSFICAKARVASGAILFALVALVLFIGTPAGAGLPTAVSSFLSTVSKASEPITSSSGTGAQG